MTTSRFPHLSLCAAPDAAKYPSTCVDRRGPSYWSYPGNRRCRRPSQGPPGARLASGPLSDSDLADSCMYYTRSKKGDGSKCSTPPVQGRT